MNDHPTTPPHVTFINMAKAAYIMHQEDNRKAHVVFLPRDLSKKMEMELDKVDMTLDKFIFDACLTYLRNKEAKKMEMRDYLFFNDLRVTDAINIKPVAQADPEHWSAWSDEDSDDEVIMMHKQADESGSEEHQVSEAANRIIGDLLAGRSNL